MTINEYQEKALRTASGYRSDSLLLNGVMGLCGESGECIDIVKKAMFQGHTLDREHLAEELGEMCIRDRLDTKRALEMLGVVKRHKIPQEELLKLYGIKASSELKVSHYEDFRKRGQAWIAETEKIYA